MLKVVDLDVYRDSVHVLRNVSLEVDEGEVVLVAGRNGAGKTTLLKSLMGLIPKKSGKVIFKGEDIANTPSHNIVRKRIGYSPEAFWVFDDLTAEENIKIGGYVTGFSKGVEEKKMSEIFDVFHELAPLINRKSLYLSGGERKMVSISRALYTSPSLLLLDEPLEGLAPVAVTRLMMGLEKIKSAGISMMIAESSYYYVDQVITSGLVDKLYLIERGEIVYGGEPSGIFEKEDILKLIRGY